MKQTEKDAMLAQVLLSFQDEDDNPYDVSDEMLVAYAEGKLSTAEAKVVARCVANNRDALTSATALTAVAINNNANSVTNLVSRLHAAILPKLQGRQKLSLAGMSSACIVALAVILITPTNKYQDLDVAFERQVSLASKPDISLSELNLGYRGENIADRYQFKGGDRSFLVDAIQHGIKNGLIDFSKVDSALYTRLLQMPLLTEHCNNVVPMNECKAMLKQGGYIGRWISMAYVNCLSLSIPPDKLLMPSISPVLESVDNVSADFLKDLSGIQILNKQSCEVISGHLLSLISSS